MCKKIQQKKKSKIEIMTKVSDASGNAEMILLFVIFSLCWGIPKLSPITNFTTTKNHSGSNEI
jgi:hypothetical protein